MQDDKKESAAPEAGPEESLGPQPGPDLESAPNVDIRPEIAEGQEQGPSTEKEIEQVREKFTAKTPPKDDDDTEEKLKALKEVDKLRDMEHEGRKIERLVELAEKKGVDFAIEVAKKTNDSCLLDLLHDKIIEKGLGKES